MKFKGTTGLFAVFVVLLVWVYFAELRWREERIQAEEEAAKVFPIEHSEIIEIRIIYPDHMIEGIRTDEGWEVTEPARIEADSGEWDLLVSNVPRIERDETVASQTKDLREYGLDFPELQIGMTMLDGTEKRVLFGRENPRKIYNYAKLDSKDEIFMIPSSWLRIFRKEANDLRDKTILKFDQDGVDLIEIASQNNLSLRKVDGVWSIEDSLPILADQSEVETFLAAINFARAVDFAAGETDIAITGLNDPLVRIVLNGAANQKRHVLMIGNEKGNGSGQYFVKDESRETVFVADSDIFSKATRPRFSWRDKTIASFNRESVLSIKLERRGGGNVTLRKLDKDWILPNGRVAQSDSVSSMFNGLEFEKAEEIIDSPSNLSMYGLEEPRLRVVLGGDGGDMLAFVFGSEVNSGKSVYWKRDEDSGVKLVPKEVFDPFNVTAEAFE